MPTHPPRARRLSAARSMMAGHREKSGPPQTRFKLSVLMVRAPGRLYRQPVNTRLAEPLVKNPIDWISAVRERAILRWPPIRIASLPLGGCFARPLRRHHSLLRYARSGGGLPRAVLA